MNRYRVPLELAGRVAVVTGAGQGIGRAIAHTFAAHQATVVVSDLHEERASRVAEEINATGGRAIPVKADVSKQEDLAALLERTIGLHNRLDILQHNAAYFPRVPFEELTPEVLDQTLSVNLKAAFWLAQKALPFLKKSPCGRILVTSSVTGPRVAYPGLAHYAASKAGLNGFIRAAALELARHRITVNGVEPGMIGTSAAVSLGDAGFQQKLAQGIPLGRLGKPEEIAAAMLFLASDAAGYITGQTIIVDGGALLPETQAVFP
ncbi:MAG: SDR family oxidoreductase [Desulfuromonadales bacterium]|nr:SDR family oxidoreductase [Desulfuromonadales bacterium]